MVSTVVQLANTDSQSRLVYHSLCLSYPQLFSFDDSQQAQVFCCWILKYFVRKRTKVSTWLHIPKYPQVLVEETLTKGNCKVSPKTFSCMIYFVTPSVFVTKGVFSTEDILSPVLEPIKTVEVPGLDPPGPAGGGS